MCRKLGLKSILELTVTYSLASLFTPEKTVDKVAIAKQIATLKAWHKATMLNDLISTENKLKEVIKAQEVKLRQVENTLETPSNTEEITEVFKLVNAELNPVIADYNRLVAKLIQQDVTAFQYERLDHMARHTLAWKSKKAVEDAASDARYAASLNAAFSGK